MGNVGRAYDITRIYFMAIITDILDTIMYAIEQWNENDAEDIRSIRFNNVVQKIFQLPYPILDKIKHKIQPNFQVNIPELDALFKADAKVFNYAIGMNLLISNFNAAYLAYRTSQTAFDPTIVSIITRYHLWSNYVTTAGAIAGHTIYVDFLPFEPSNQGNVLTKQTIARPRDSTLHPSVFAGLTDQTLAVPANLCLRAARNTGGNQPAGGALPIYVEQHVMIPQSGAAGPWINPVDCWYVIREHPTQHDQLGCLFFQPDVVFAVPSNATETIDFRLTMEFTEIRFDSPPSLIGVNT